MNRFMQNVILTVLLLFNLTISAQTDTTHKGSDSLNSVLLKGYIERLKEIEQQVIADSIKKAELETQLNSLRTTDNLRKEELQRQLKKIEEGEKLRIAQKKARIDSLRDSAIGYPVIGVLRDTLFRIYAKIGYFTPGERATNISKRIRILYEDDFLNLDSITTVVSENNTIDIVYGETHVMSISEADALWADTTMQGLANNYSVIIKNSIITAKKERSLPRIFSRTGLVLVVIASAWLIIWILGKGNARLVRFIETRKDKWLKHLAYKDYTFLTVEQELQVILFVINFFRWLFFGLLIYITLPVVFSIFPFTRGWADKLFYLLWFPFKKVFTAVWEYLPNLVTILVIFIVMRYLVRFVKYIFSEVESGKLKISGFYADWAMPTFSIVRILLYAFMLVLIFPYLPGSDSTIFKGVSVFLGILFSLGSSSAIANMIAGLVITYMRPFKIGDRIQIGEVTGDVVEKSLLVTRLRTVKNEVVTIPNSSILSGNTINYSSEASGKGLIIHTTVTIGYDIPWESMHKALIDAALRTEDLLKDPMPFVLQTGLDDFYVSYQINAYTKEPKRMALIRSDLHQNIQDVCNERGLEILSPHYRSLRDGNTTTIPAGYYSKDYKAPAFRVEMEKEIVQNAP